MLIIPNDNENDKGGCRKVLANLDIRQAIEAGGFKYWMVAHAYGCTDTTFSKKLRRELPNGEKAKIFTAIKSLTESAKQLSGGQNK